MMEGLSLNSDAILRRSAITISPGGVPLAHDRAGKRHFQDQSVNDADEQIAVRQVPYALHRSVGLMNAMDLARLINSEKPSPVGQAFAGSCVAAHVEQNHAGLAVMRLAVRDADRRQVSSIHCHRGAITSLALRTISAGVRKVSATCAASSAPGIGKRSA